MSLDLNWHDGPHGDGEYTLEIQAREDVTIRGIAEHPESLQLVQLILPSKPFPISLRVGDRVVLSLFAPNPVGPNWLRIELSDGRALDVSSPDTQRPTAAVSIVFETEEIGDPLIAGRLVVAGLGQACQAHLNLPAVRVVSGPLETSTEKISRGDRVYYPLVIRGADPLEVSLEIEHDRTTRRVAIPALTKPNGEISLARAPGRKILVSITADGKPIPRSLGRWLIASRLIHELTIGLGDGGPIESVRIDGPQELMVLVDQPCGGTSARAQIYPLPSKFFRAPGRLEIEVHLPDGTSLHHQVHLVMIPSRRRQFAMAFIWLGGSTLPFALQFALRHWGGALVAVASLLLLVLGLLRYQESHETDLGGGFFAELQSALGANGSEQGGGAPDGH